MPLMIELVQTPTDQARMLIEALESELSADFAAEQRHGFSVARIFQPNVLFFIAWMDGSAAGCGGIALDDGYAEVKRMYVRPEERGRRIGRAILARLEEETRARGVNHLLLETGDVLHAAIRMYERAGFKRCGAFGAYAAMPPEAIARSVFLEKWLGEASSQ